MSLRTIAGKFVEMCNQGKNFDVTRTLYAPNIAKITREQFFYDGAH